MEIQLDKDTSFTFEMKIDGDVSTSSPPIMRFSILNDKMILSFVANRIENGVYQVDLPSLKNVLAAGEYTANIEVFLDGKHFTPLTQKIKLKQEVKPVVKMAETAKAKEAEPQITVDSIQVKEVKFKKTDEIVSVKK